MKFDKFPLFGSNPYLRHHLISILFDLNHFLYLIKFLFLKQILLIQLCAKQFFTIIIIIKLCMIDFHTFLLQILQIILALSSDE